MPAYVTSDRYPRELVQSLQVPQLVEQSRYLHNMCLALLGVESCWPIQESDCLWAGYGTSAATLGIWTCIELRSRDVLSRDVHAEATQRMSEMAALQYLLAAQGDPWGFPEWWSDPAIHAYFQWLLAASPEGTLYPEAPPARLPVGYLVTDHDPTIATQDLPLGGACYCTRRMVIAPPRWSVTSLDQSPRDPLHPTTWWHCTRCGGTSIPWLTAAAGYLSDTTFTGGPLSGERYPASSLVDQPELLEGYRLAASAGEPDFFAFAEASTGDIFLREWNGEV